MVSMFIYLFINFASQAGRGPQQLYANFCGPFYPPNSDNNGRQLATTPRTLINKDWNL